MSADTRRAAEVVVASNRGPVSFVRASQGYEPRPGIGAVAEMLGSALARAELASTWIACAVSDDDRGAVASGVLPRAAASLEYAVDYLLPSSEDFRGYYDEVSNRALWIACHDLWADTSISAPSPGWERSLAAYEAVNRAFAASASRHAAAAAPVLFNDYHLWTAPRHLRMLRANQPSLVFTHTPWSADGFARLREEFAMRLVEGICSASIAGFQAPAWGREFLRTCASLGWEVDSSEMAVRPRSGARATSIRIYPAPIDPERITERGVGPAASAWARRFRNQTSGRLVVRIDRIEPSKNALRGFLAFERLLERGDALARSSTFVALLLARRQEIPEYVRYREELERTVARINDRYPGAVRVYIGDDRDRAFGALRQFDVLLVNSLRDGMNLVSKEGALLNERDGVLVLSSTVGAAAELGDCSLIIEDSENVEETAQRLSAALRLEGTKRKEYASRAKAIVSSRSPRLWLEEQMRDLRGN